MKRIFLDDLHEYDYIREEQGDEIIHSLFHSISDSWQEEVKGTLVVSVKENTVDLSFELAPLLPEFNTIKTYSDTNALMLLLRLALETQKIEIYEQTEL